MKKILSIAILAMASAALNVQAQDSDSTYVPKHEFGITGFGGLSSLQTSVDGLDHKMGLGGGGGFSYIYHFNKNWGLLTGAQAAFYNGKLKANELYSLTATDGTVTFHPYNNPTHPQTRDIKTVTLTGSEYTNFEEKHSATYLQIPIMAQFMTPMGKNHFYVAAGVKAGIRLTDKYKQKATARTMTATFGSYAYELIVAGAPAVTRAADNVDADLWSREEAGTYGYARIAGGNPANYTYGTPTDVKKNASLESKMFNMTASAELGFRWALSKTMGLYTGLYVDYGFLNCRPDQLDQAFEPGQGSILAYKYMQNDRVAAATGYNDSKINPSYPYFPITDPDPVGVKRTNKLADRLSTLACGLTLRLTFGKKTSGTKVKKEKPVKVVPPVPVEKTEPVENVIPEDINVKMRELSNTLFAFDKFDLNDKAKATLDEIADWLNKHPELNVEIQGHTDNKGADKYNQTLSENRAKAVHDYFVSKGVNKSRLSYKGYGKTQPIATNDTEEGRQLNRRVELKIIK